MSRQSKITSFFAKRFSARTPVEISDEDEDEEAPAPAPVETDGSPRADSSDYVAEFLSSAVDDLLASPASLCLFGEEETETLRKFSELPGGQKRLFARTYRLRREWNRIDDLVAKYSSSKDAARALRENRLLEYGDETMRFDDWVRVAKKNELTDACKHFKLSANGDKKTVTETLRKFCQTKYSIFGGDDAKRTESVVVKWMSKKIGDCARIDENSKDLFDRLRSLVYLGVNPAIVRENRLDLMLLNAKIGRQTFPTDLVRVDPPACAFPSKNGFDDYFRMNLLYEQILSLTRNPPCDHLAVIDLARRCLTFCRTDEDDADRPEPPEWLHRFSSGYVRTKALELSVPSFKATKTENHLDEALSVLDSMLKQKKYRRHKRALWYDEKVLILHTRLRRFEQAAEVLKTALNETEIGDDEKAPLKVRALRLARQKNIDLSKSTRNELLTLCREVEPDLPFVEISARSANDSTPGRKAKYLFRDALSGDKIYSSVEDFALLYYLNDLHFTNGEHWEGRIVRSIFILLFWDIIYGDANDRPGIFLSRYQDAPLDLYTSAFYENRKDKIEKRLEDIETERDGVDDVVDSMKKTYSERREGEVSLFDSNIEWTKIREIVVCLGRIRVARLCRRLAENFQYASSGFPDLTVWNYSLKKIKFVEVKGDGDRLSNKQTLWMRYLLKCGIDTEVCYVHKSSTKKKSPQKSAKDKDEKKTRKRRANFKPEEPAAVQPEIAAVPLKISVRSDAYLKKTPSPSSRKRIESASNNVSDCYLKSPTKFSKGVGYFVSPNKNHPNGELKNEQISSSSSYSPKKSKGRLSLSLTKRRLFERDT